MIMKVMELLLDLILPILSDEYRDKATMDLHKTKDVDKKLYQEED